MTLESTGTEQGEGKNGDEGFVEICGASSDVALLGRFLPELSPLIADDFHLVPQRRPGDEELAREALKRRESYAVDAASLKAQLDQQKGVVDNLISNTKLLERKIQEARLKKDTLKARAQSAKTSIKVSKLAVNINTSSALSAFEKIEEKVLAMEMQAESLNQLATDELEGKFALLESSSVDDDLDKLKREISRSSLKGELPAGRTIVSSSYSSSTFRVTEIERELNELRRKVNE